MGEEGLTRHRAAPLKTGAAQAAASKATAI